MAQGLFVIVSTVPERISQYVHELRTFAPNFLFFSSVESLLAKPPLHKLKLIVIDNTEDDLSIVQHISALRRIAAYKQTIILMIAKEGGSDSGIAAMEVGCNDYLAANLVNRELATRVRLFLNARVELDVQVEGPYNLETIYPLEDRLTIKNALWHLQRNLSVITSVSELSFHVGRSIQDINRAFSLHLGQTAAAYMREFRIKKAKTLLAKTRFPIGHIAQDVGYSSAANFSTAFKRVVGLCPAEYREQTLPA